MHFVASDGGGALFCLSCSEKSTSICLTQWTGWSLLVSMATHGSSPMATQDIVGWVGLEIIWFGMGWGGVRKKHICFGLGWEWIGFLPISRANLNVATVTAACWMGIWKKQQSHQSMCCETTIWVDQIVQSTFYFADICLYLILFWSGMWNVCAIKPRRVDRAFWEARTYNVDILLNF